MSPILPSPHKGIPALNVYITTAEHGHATIVSDYRDYDVQYPPELRLSFDVDETTEGRDLKLWDSMLLSWYANAHSVLHKDVFENDPLRPNTFELCCAVKVAARLHVVQQLDLYLDLSKWSAQLLSEAANGDVPKKAGYLTLLGVLKNHISDHDWIEEHQSVLQHYYHQLYAEPMRKYILDAGE